MLVRSYLAKSKKIRSYPVNGNGGYLLASELPFANSIKLLSAKCRLSQAQQYRIKPRTQWQFDPQLLYYPKI
ncbi:hypothetical protein OK016_00860 [Vibrio chagasii]|nr:hypothetical protein [Vibrio chagasii]